MKNPQTLAIELAEYFDDKNLRNISKYGCCAFVLMWCLGIEPDSDVDAILILVDLIRKKKIKEDCTVKWAEAVKYLSGRELTAVDFIDTKIISNIKERTPVRFDYNGKSHWVGVENGKVCFNPLIYSNCVANGRPGSKRVIHIKGVN